MIETTKHLKFLSISMLLLSMLWGCSGSGIKTQHDFNPSVNFANYQTYAFISENPMIVSQAEGAISPLLQGRLMESIRIAMNGKGYNEIKNPEAADMAIAFTVGSRDQIKVDSYPASYSMGYGSFYGHGRYGGYGGYGMNYGTETRVRQYTEGELAVDVFDVASHHPAFHGKATKKISEADQKNAQEVLNLITAEALSAFPLAGYGASSAGLETN